MERLTERDAHGNWRIKRFTEILPAHWQACNRLAAIEDILGDEYDLDRLRELAQADREGRCVVMPCQPGDKISYKSGAGLLCNAVIDEYTPKNIFITAKTEIPNAEPLSQTFSISEVEAALRRKQDG